jgi:osmotically-inducible protein OsmY
MKKITPVLLSSLLLLGAVACSGVEKTGSEAPDSTQDNPQALNQEEVKDAQEDAQSEVRRDQLNSDIRANEQRNNTFNDGQAENRSDDALANEVRSKLEANIPQSQLTVDAEEGVVTVTGTVPVEKDVNKIEPLASEIKGVKQVVNKATYAPPTTESDDSGN